MLHGVKFFSARHPNETRVESMGQTYEGREIKVIVLCFRAEGRCEQRNVIFVDGGGREGVHNV